MARSDPGGAFGPQDDDPGYTFHDLVSGKSATLVYASRVKLTNGNANNAVIDQYWPVWFRPGLWNANPFQWSGQRQSAFEAAFSTLIPIDFDGDGDLDLVGSAFYNPRAPPCTLHAYRNDGKGHFTEATKDVFGENPIVVLSARRAATGDINQDGRADLILTDSGSDYFCCKPAPARNRVFIQTPDGRLAEQTAGRMPLRDEFAHESDFADIDGDESIDPGVRQQLRRKTARCWVFSGARRRKAHGCSLENRALEGLRMRLAPWACFIRRTEPVSSFSTSHSRGLHSRTGRPGWACEFVSGDQQESYS